LTAAAVSDLNVRLAPLAAAVVDPNVRVAPDAAAVILMFLVVFFILKSPFTIEFL